MSSAPQPDSHVYFTNRFGTSYGKPSFPTIKHVPKSLAQLAGPSSVGFFWAMGLDYSFLQEEAETIGAKKEKFHGTDALFSDNFHIIFN